MPTAEAFLGPCLSCYWPPLQGERQLHPRTCSSAFGLLYVIPSPVSGHIWLPPWVSGQIGQHGRAAGLVPTGYTYGPCLIGLNHGAVLRLHLYWPTPGSPNIGMVAMMSSILVSDSMELPEWNH